MSSRGSKQGFHQFLAIGFVADEVWARQRLYSLREHRIIVPVEAPEEINELLLNRLVQNDSGAPFRQPMARLDARQPNWDGAVQTSLVNPIWQQPCRILPAFIIVDRPVEMHVAVDAG